MHQTRESHRATSSTFPDRWIGRAYGQDRAIPNHFAKKTSIFSKINLQAVHLSHYEKILNFSRNQPSVQQSRFKEIYKKKLKFS